MVPHLDGDPRSVKGAGQEASINLIAKLRAAHVNAYFFHWDGFHQELGASCGVVGAQDVVRDLADGFRQASCSGTDFNLIAQAFRIGLAQGENLWAE